MSYKLQPIGSRGDRLLISDFLPSLVMAYIVVDSTKSVQLRFQRNYCEKTLSSPAEVHKQAFHSDTLSETLFWAWKIYMGSSSAAQMMNRDV